MTAKRNALPGYFYLIRPAIISPGCELAHFIELTVVRQRDLRHEAEYPAVLNDRGAVIELAVYTHRNTDGCKAALAARILSQSRERFKSAAQKLVRIKKIAAGIRGEVQLRQHKQICAHVFSLVKAFLRLLKIIYRIPHLEFGTCRGRLYKTVFHLICTLLICLLLNINPRK